MADYIHKITCRAALAIWPNDAVNTALMYATGPGVDRPATRIAVWSGTMALISATAVIGARNVVRDAATDEVIP